jgi:hypothetical protein
VHPAFGAGLSHWDVAFRRRCDDNPIKVFGADQFLVINVKTGRKFIGQMSYRRIRVGDAHQTASGQTGSDGGMFGADKAGADNTHPNGRFVFCL